MSRRGVETKPSWSAVPREVKEEVAILLGSPVVRASRVFGGYAPSATFRLVLADSRRAFFKGVYPLPADSGVRWDLEREEEIYRGCARWMRPWAPEFHGSVEAAGWHAIVLEDLGPANALPWTRAKARRATRSYARFHKATYGEPLPRWLSRIEHRDFAVFWERLVESRELGEVAALAGRRRDQAEEWLDVALPVLRGHAARLAKLRPPFSFLHFDTRSDNIRLHGDRLRIFDWNFACAGPHEFEVAAFAQAIEAESGPPAERVVAWYAEVLPVRDGYLDASLAGIAGYFADRGWRPDLPGLPRVRSWQRRQLETTLAWSARRFGLPEPRWIAAIRA